MPGDTGELASGKPESSPPHEGKQGRGWKGREGRKHSQLGSVSTEVVELRQSRNDDSVAEPSGVTPSGSCDPRWGRRKKSKR